MSAIYATSRKGATAKPTNLEKSAFADFLAPLYATKTPRGELVDTLRTLINAGAVTVTCWRDLYRVLAKRDASYETILIARQLWAQFRSTKFAASPATTRRASNA